MTANITRRHSSAERTVAFVLTLPFLAVAKGGTMARNIINRQPKANPVKPATKASAPVAAPTAQPVEPPRQLIPADRVHSEWINSERVSFYHYAKPGLIRVVTRTNGFPKEGEFTPEDAQLMSLPFNIESAVRWVQQFGFRKPGTPAARVAKPAARSDIGGNAGNARSQQAKEAADASAPSTEETPRRRDKVEATPSASERTASQSFRPKIFEGRIVSFGTTKRKSQSKINDKKKREYVTYQMTLDNPHIGEREFIGEHLEILVEEMELQPGQFVRLEQLGKREFTVEVNGKDEQRHRNEYAITIL